MAQPTNDTKTGAGILPDTELNPLVNPLLAAHMGRWAEVYFTSPPEKRAQAVSDLVRELSGMHRLQPRPNGEQRSYMAEGSKTPRRISSPNSEPPHGPVRILRTPKRRLTKILRHVRRTPDIFAGAAATIRGTGADRACSLE